MMKEISRLAQGLCKIADAMLPLLLVKMAHYAFFLLYSIF
jgi:hypothetical protein